MDSFQEPSKQPLQLLTLKRMAWDFQKVQVPGKATELRLHEAICMKERQCAHYTSTLHLKHISPLK